MSGMLRMLTVSQQRLLNHIGDKGYLPSPANLARTLERPVQDIRADLRVLIDENVLELREVKVVFTQDIAAI